MSNEKMYSNKYQKSLSQQLLFEVPLFRFQFVSALYYLDCYYNAYLMKQTASLYLKLPLNSIFLVCFCYIWKDTFLLVLDLFISEYLDRSPPWKGVKEAFSVKCQTENLAFGLDKIKQNPGFPNKEDNAVFKHIHQK